MIKNFTAKTFSSVRLALAINEDFEFILTGSRFFGYNTEKSDWDFFTQAPPDPVNLITFLTELGFQSIYRTGYKDREITVVYRHPTERIDIQVVKDAALKNKIQERLLTLAGIILMRNIPKDVQSTLWDMMYALMSNIPNDQHQLNRPSKDPMDKFLG